MNAEASKRGWLKPRGMLRYANYNEPYLGDEEFIDTSASYEAKWRSGTLGRVIVMLIAHAKVSGVSRARFFKEAHETLNLSEKRWDVFDGEVEMRARHIAKETVKALMDGPEFPTTSLSLPLPRQP